MKNENLTFWVWMIFAATFARTAHCVQRFLGRNGEICWKRSESIYLWISNSSILSYLSLTRHNHPSIFDTWIDSQDYWRQKLWQWHLILYNKMLQYIWIVLVLCNENIVYIIVRSWCIRILIWFKVFFLYKYIFTCSIPNLWWKWEWHYFRGNQWQIHSLAYIYKSMKR